MSVRARIVVLLYAFHSVWSAWCAVQQYLFGNYPVAGIFLLFSFVPIAAILEQDELVDLRAEAAYYEARARRQHARTAELQAAGLQRVDAP
ncbi:hypothetical protein [Streptomyces prunicolor]|uniref:hypothetical protein n=1 Tax=Streptomyces prunicolor TaxID=67348 RepID=UPI00035D400E|nr:hypothetical protein [Streptomyces prunicolor]